MYYIVSIYIYIYIYISTLFYCNERYNFKFALSNLKTIYSYKKSFQKTEECFGSVAQERKIIRRKSQCRVSTEQPSPGYWPLSSTPFITAPCHINLERKSKPSNFLSFPSKRPSLGKRCRGPQAIQPNKGLFAIVYRF